MKQFLTASYTKIKKKRNGGVNSGPALLEFDRLDSAMAKWPTRDFSQISMSQTAAKASCRLSPRVVSVSHAVS